MDVSSFLDETPSGGCGCGGDPDVDTQRIEHGAPRITGGKESRRGRRTHNVQNVHALPRGVAQDHAEALLLRVEQRTAKALPRGVAQDSWFGGADPLEKVSTRPDECAYNPNRKPGEPCSSPEVIQTVADLLQESPRVAGASMRGEAARGAAHGTAHSTAHRKHSTKGKNGDAPGALPNDGGAVSPLLDVAALLNCDSESCVVQHPKVREYARKVGKEDILDENIERNFKPSGPRESNALTSNYDLDAVLRQWTAEFPNFFPYPFAMIDFRETGGSLATIEPAAVIRGEVPVSIGLTRRAQDKRPCNHMACIVNTDYSTGPGKHWVAVFIDARSDPWTVEYFNSAGNPPPRQITRWMEETRMDLAREFQKDVITIPVTRVRHQKSRTECGLYSLYYIRRRCEGGRPDEFAREEIPDDAMFEFRKHVFRAH